MLRQSGTRSFSSFMDSGGGEAGKGRERLRVEDDWVLSQGVKENVLKNFRLFLHKEASTEVPKYDLSPRP